MDLIDRYLIAVRRQLPRDLEADVAPELADSLRSEAEEQERIAGRPLTEAEQAALLKKRGHPFIMASRYLPQQQLIGPALFPFYRQALKFVVFWVVVPIALFGGAIHAIYTNAPSAIVGRIVGAAWNGAIYAVGIVTIVFAILDHEKVRINVLDSWNPAKLREPKAGRPVPRSESVMGLVVSLVFLAWWTTLVRSPELMFYADARLRFTAAPIWSQLYFPILLSVAASVGVHLVDVLRPWRTFAISAADLAINFLNVFIVTQVLRAGRYVEVTGAPADADKVELANHWLNQIIGWAFMIIGVVIILEVCFELWRMVKARRTLRATISSTAL
jgi:hypothetical protein